MPIVFGTCSALAVIWEASESPGGAEAVPELELELELGLELELELLVLPQPAATTASTSPTHQRRLPLSTMTFLPAIELGGREHVLRLIAAIYTPGLFLSQILTPDYVPAKTRYRPS
ncbi:MAG TPA: hypothetical protein VGF93_14310 [Solirubrobacteraceae bacterium]|jgi:hypothetical protein